MNAALKLVKILVEDPVAALKHHLAIYMFGAPGRARLLQDFSQDASVLKKALETKKRTRRALAAAPTCLARTRQQSVWSRGVRPTCRRL